MVLGDHTVKCVGEARVQFRCKGDGQDQRKEMDPFFRVFKYLIGTHGNRKPENHRAGITSQQEIMVFFSFTGLGFQVLGF